MHVCAECGVQFNGRREYHEHLVATNFNGSVKHVCPVQRDAWRAKQQAQSEALRNKEQGQ